VQLVLRLDKLRLALPYEVTLGNLISVLPPHQIATDRASLLRPQPNTNAPAHPPLTCTQPVKQDPARQFADLVHSFPTYASRVSRIKAKATEIVTAAMHTWHQSGAAQMLPTNCVLINGRYVSMAGNTFNVYDMLHTVRAELDQISRLDTFTSGSCALKQDDIRSLEVAASSLASGESTAGKLSARVDVSRGAKHVVTFLNNLEKDDAYQQWPRHLSVLLTPSWSLHQIRRNLFTIVAVADALTYEGALLIYQFQMMLNQHFPLRVGLVPVCSADAIAEVEVEAVAESETRASDLPATRAEVCALFSVARDKYSGAAAGAFLAAVAQATLEKQQRRSQAEAVLKQMKEAHAAGQPTGGQYGSTPEEEIAAIEGMVAELQEQTIRDTHSAFAAAISAHTEGVRADVPVDLLAALPGTPKTREGYRQEARTVLSSPAVQEYTAKYAAAATAYVFARGLPVNSYSLNGMVETSLDLQQGLMQMLGKEQQLLTQWVNAGKIDDKTKSLFTAILTLSNAYPRYHPLLEEAGGQIQYLDTHASSGGVMRVLRASYQAGSYFVSGAADKGYYSTTLMSVPASRAGYEALHAACVWLFGSEQQRASSQAHDETSTPAPAQRLAYFVAVPDAALACLDGSNAARGAGDEKDSSACAATAMYQAPYYQVASLLLSLQEHASHTTSLYQDIVLLLQTASSASLNIDSLRKDLLPSLASFSALAAEVQRRISASMDFSATTNEPGPELRSNLRKLNVQTRAAVGSGFYGAKSSPTDVLVTFNGRRLSVPVSASEEPAMSEHDFTLLAAVERARVGSALESIMTAVYDRHPSDKPLSKKQMDEMSDLFLHMHSFCGSFASGTRRFNVDDILAGVGAAVVGYGEDAFVRNEFGEPLHGLPLSFQVSPVSSTSEQDDTAHGHLRIVYIVDPLSVAGQRAAALLSLVRDQLQLEQQVILTPKLDIASNEFPLQNFYRYVLGGSAAANDVAAGRAAFKDLPRQHTLTVRIDAPESWNIQATVAQQDMDNLHCLSKDDCGDSSADGVASQVTTVGYTLKSILVAGQCFETPRVITLFSGTSLPVNGLQLTLRSVGGGVGDAGSVHSDTLVMQNLGYFQLAASAPGLYALTLAEGRGADLFTIDGASTVHPHAVDALQPNSPAAHIKGGKLLAVRSFSDTDSANSNRISVTKRMGMEGQVLLEGGEDDDEALVYSRTGRRTQSADPKKGKKGKGKKTASKKTGMLSSIKSMFAAADSEEVGQQVAADGDGRIHVFSLATGHMYERLLRIMMLSVTKRSSMPIKFWLFENYLSPKFKEIAAIMAKQYGFEVGYVTYKWPAWLTQQTQKQRIIWGYKILFLDVLFPLGVKKVIYVDADQVVRADLKELWDLDLEGKPYAYTPFCTSREETLGFQFWRQGYWNDHLQGRPYHISALYVVDLANFRRNAVGDQLRAIYDGLARDPNSLANLDQDLPNYAQHQVPIHSLPQEWLWCETWCSDASKTAAKTIDLCNNPLHKEPKLDMARRVISGELFPESWVELDSEIRALEKANGF